MSHIHINRCNSVQVFDLFDIYDTIILDNMQSNIFEIFLSMFTNIKRCTQWNNHQIDKLRCS